MDADLYRLSGELLNVSYPRVRVLDSDPLGYLLTAIADEEADYVINLDEDAFVTDNAAMVELLDHVIEHGYVNCGMPDGGVVTTRHHNPWVTNPFFTIMDTRVLREHIDGEPWVGTPVLASIDGFPRELLRCWYEPGSFEPYDEFLTWVAMTFPVLYLDAETHYDGITTILRNHEGKPFLRHAWYGRDYHRQRHHFDRINTVIAECRRGT
jgi:hypothetical protein